MRITEVERWAVVVPCRDGVLERDGRWHDPDWSEKPMDAGLSTFDRVPKWIVRVRTDTGLTGVGESLRGETAAQIEEGAQSLLGRDPRTLPLHRLPLPSATYTTFEMALLDLLGHAWEVPAYQLLGGARQGRVALDYWASRHAPEVTAAHAREARRLGFPGIKLKIALASDRFGIAQDDPVAEVVRAIREACGDDFSITIDPNFRFNTPEQALAVAGELASLNVTVLEDPIEWNAADLSPFAALRRKCPVPLALHVHDAGSVLAAIRADAASYLNVYASMADFARLTWLAEQAGIRCWHASGMDLGIRDASYIHASFAAPATLPGDMVGHLLREDDLIVDPIPIVDGHVPLLTTPGLGVTLDEEAVARYAVDMRT